MNKPTVKPEFTGVRDLSLNDRHRKWGWDCPGADIDFLMIEYNSGKPCAIVEYKRKTAPMPNYQSATFRAIRWICDTCQIPFILAFYDDNEWWFRVYPMNKKAEGFCKPEQLFTEREFARMLYIMRSRVIESEVLNQLNDTKPVDPKRTV